jgi:CheY-like chemotaxis protein
MNRQTILAVLNDDDLQGQMVASLDGEVSITTARTFSRAIEILRMSQIDLIVSDIRAHDDESDFASVFDFLRWVKGDPFARLLPFVCYSESPAQFKYQTDALRTAALALGAVLYLEMDNFDQSLFRQEIDRLLLIC